MNWKQAKQYCQELTLGGYDDWRLPTIYELRSLYRGCPAEETTNSCKGDCSTLLCETKTQYEYCGNCPLGGGPDNGCYWPEELEGSCSKYWSATKVDKSFIRGAWVASYYSGEVTGTELKRGYRHVRCVRDVD